MRVRKPGFFSNGFLVFSRVDVRGGGCDAPFMNVSKKHGRRGMVETHLFFCSLFLKNEGGKSEEGSLQERAGKLRRGSTCGADFF